MALSKATRDLKDVVTCAICVDDFADKDPRTLQCLHAFCARCLDQLHNTKMTGYITCPTCMEQTKLPHGSVYNLRPYFVAKQVRDVLRGLSRSQGDMFHLCTRCRRHEDAISYCFDCTTAMCAPCIDKHNQRRGNKSHVNVAVTLHTIHSLVCKIHRELAEDFCIDCMCVACNSCHDTVHHGHRHRPFSLEKEEVDRISLESLDRELDREGEVLENLLEIERVSLTEFSATKRTMEKCKQEIIGHVTWQTTDLTCEAGKPHEKLQAALADIRKPVAERRDVITQLRTKTYNIIAPIPAIPSLYLPDIHHLVQEQERLIPQRINYDLPVVENKRFIPYDRKIEDVKIGCLCSDADEAGGGECPEWTRVWKKHSLKKYQAVDFLPNGDIIAILDYKVYMCDQNGQSKPVPFPVDKLSAVSKVVVHRPSSTVAVIEYTRKITLFTPDQAVTSNECDKYDGEVKSDGEVKTHTFEESDIPKQKVNTSKINQSKASHGLTWRVTEILNIGKCAAFTPEGDLIVGGDDKLMKYSILGDLVWTEDLNYKCGDITITPDGTIITCPEGAYKCLYIYNRHGMHMRDVPQPARTRLGKVDLIDLFKTGSLTPGDEQSLFTNWATGDVYFRFDVLSDLFVLNMAGGFKSGPKVLSHLEKWERVITGMSGFFASINGNHMVIGSGRDLMLYEYKIKPPAHADTTTSHEDDELPHFGVFMLMWIYNNPIHTMIALLVGAFMISLYTNVVLYLRYLLQ